MEVLDLKDMRCPKPIIEISKRIRALQPGDQIEIHATDPVFPADLEAWCKKTSNKILSMETEQNVHRAIVELT